MNPSRLAICSASSTRAHPSRSRRQKHFGQRSSISLSAFTVVASAMARRRREGLAAIAARSRHFGRVGVVAGVELLRDAEIEFAPLAFLVPIVVVQIGTSSIEYGRPMRTPPTYYIRKRFGLNSPSWKNRSGISYCERCGDA